MLLQRAKITHVVEVIVMEFTVMTVQVSGAVIEL